MRKTGPALLTPTAATVSLFNKKIIVIGIALSLACFLWFIQVTNLNRDYHQQVVQLERELEGTKLYYSKKLKHLSDAYHQLVVKQKQARQDDDDDSDGEALALLNEINNSNKAIKLSHKLCKIARRYMGERKYGGWMICPLGLRSDSIVYSFGIGENAVFENELVRQYSLNKLYAFDPTPKSIEYVKMNQNSGALSDRIELHAIALSADPNQSQMKMFLPKNAKHVSGSLLSGQSHLNTDDSITVTTRTLKQIMQQLNHDHIDLLKIDIEGAEFDVLEGLFGDHSFDACNQILIEQHDRFFTNDAANDRLERMKQLFAENGFRLLHNEKNEEYTFIRE